MPIYEYACTACGERTEARQSFSDPPLEKCEICGGKLRKLYSPVGIVFKGSGFYSTDAKKKSSSSGSSSSGSSESKGSADSKASGDSAKKTETKKESSTTSKGEKSA
jgi:putative FmdB family regulatory protein